ncbi:MAG: sulfur reduction protein DsrE [Chlorobiaceae bacterium]|nr:sulfur reduction protein DsrE [Chlorobiaceae bacterium]NTV59909.1 sulfur reduction protein DsrE [Chlorobiaceae bacterium]
MSSSRLLIISTTGRENPEKAVLPFVLATASQSLNVEVVMFLQSSAVRLACRGEAEKVRAEGFLSLERLMETFINLGGKIYLCSPCITERKIVAEDLVEGVEIAGAGILVEEVMTARSVVTY